MRDVVCVLGADCTCLVCFCACHVSSCVAVYLRVSSSICMHESVFMCPYTGLQSPGATSATPSPVVDSSPPPIRTTDQLYSAAGWFKPNEARLSRMQGPYEVEAWLCAMGCAVARDLSIACGYCLRRLPYGACFVVGAADVAWLPRSPVCPAGAQTTPSKSAILDSDEELGSEEEEASASARYGACPARGGALSRERC